MSAATARDLPRTRRLSRAAGETLGAQRLLGVAGATAGRHDD